MCAQRLLCCQALAEKKLTLGVLCGLKYLYRNHGLPPCITGDVIRWSESEMPESELAMA